ncbi:sigma-54-dependent transcriptional regulator [Tunturibacter empetritectus]|uniref:Two-component system response regulator AtoC n=1 Tax=Tunturiibacter lichenicola TaxID=2051959 RepID=A0A7W8J9I0_9BACT|nr:sigma-54 dependent transcriptional regulator [Edaphobacter lichenicola]MBB5345085.1 two-component system response regulator AtoC [Edaphobacter lichenicola]
MTERILIVDDERNLRESLSEALSQAGYQVLTASDGKEAYSMIQEQELDLLLCDWRMPEMDGATLLNLLREEGRLVDLPALVITAHGTSNNAIDAIQLGAYDFVTKPFDLDDVIVTIRRALEHSSLQKEVKQLRRQVGDPSPRRGEIIGTSPLMLNVFKEIGRVAQTNSTVLITGESGTGKELVAKSIHAHSERRNAAFVVVNCAALPENLIESELFGYEKGAFTGALNRKVGKFESAQGGTIFLDEVGELPLETQPKLLRVLQEHTFERLGGTQSVDADFRVIAATNLDLEEEVAAGHFRSDLYFRLSVVPIRLPSLRERRSDILPLAEHFLQSYSEKHGLRATGFVEDTILKLQRHAFPGNVRELEHIVERAVVRAGGRAITCDLIVVDELATTELSIGSGLEKLLELPYRESIQAWERLLIERALKAAGGNKAEAARALGVHRRLLYEKLGSEIS